MSADTRHVYVGELAETPLPEMLAIIHRNRVPGVLEAQLGDATKMVFIMDGDIIFATSTNRGDSLGDMLMASGRLTVEQHRASTLLLLENPRRRHGQVLVEMGLLSEDEMRQAVLEQVQRIVWSLFDVADGRVSFILGQYRAEETYKLRIPTLRAVLHGCKTVGDAKRLVTRLGGKATVFARALIPEHLVGFELEASEQSLLELVDGRRTLFELCEQGPYSAGLNARVLYAFQCLGLVRKEKDAPSGIRVHVPSNAGPI